jgi:hypothetical protein
VQGLEQIAAREFDQARFDAHSVKKRPWALRLDEDEPSTNTCRKYKKKWITHAVYE